MKLFIYNNKLTDLQKVRSVLELEGEICSLDPNIKRVRQQIYVLCKDEHFDVWKEDCSCKEGKMRATLNRDGTPRKHKKYFLEWAL